MEPESPQPAAPEGQRLAAFFARSEHTQEARAARGNGERAWAGLTARAMRTPPSAPDDAYSTLPELFGGWVTSSHKALPGSLLVAYYNPAANRLADDGLVQAWEVKVPDGDLTKSWFTPVKHNAVLPVGLWDAILPWVSDHIGNHIAYQASLAAVSKELAQETRSELGAPASARTAPK